MRSARGRQEKGVPGSQWNDGRADDAFNENNNSGGGFSGEGQSGGFAGDQPFGPGEGQPYDPAGGQPFGPGQGQPFGPSGLPYASAPIGSPYPVPPNRYQPLDPDLPPRDSVSTFRAIPKVISKLLHKDTANGFAWAFAARNYGWTVFLTLSVLAGIMASLVILSTKFAVASQAHVPVSTVILGGVGFAVASFLDSLVTAVAVYGKLRWHQVKTSFSDAVTIWAAAYTVQLFLSVMFFVGIVLAILLLALAPWLGAILLFALIIGYSVATIWVLVIAYQGQRWYSGSGESFVGKWVLMIILTGIVSNILFSAVGGYAGFNDVLPDPATSIDMYQ